jgi:hypothetical protein
VYIGSTLIWSYSAFDPDAQLFITNAAITEPVQQNAVNNLVINLKNYGIWSKMKALYPMVGGTAAQHKFNLKNPLDTDAAFRLVFNGGWVHSSTGSTPNGVNAYADTKCNPFLNLTGYSQHVSMYSRTQNTSVNGVNMGVFVSPATSEISLYQYYSAVSVKGGSSYEYPTYAVTINNTNTLGLQVVSRTANNSLKLHFNGSLLQTNTNTETKTRPNADMFIGASNFFGTTGPTQYTPHENAFSSIGDGLTDTEAANYYTAVQTFQTSLNRQVGVPIVSDADAQAFLNAAVIEDVTQANAVNTLVTDLKGYGIWTKMKALYPFVGGTASQHKFNLRNPLDTDAAFRLVFNGGWTHSLNGALPNGTNAYANTFFKGTNWTTKDNACMSYYSRTDVNGSQVEIGLYDSGTALNNSLAVRYNNSFQSLLNLFGNNGWLLVANTSSTGQFMANRYVVNSLNSWKNGVKQGEISSTPFAGVYSPTLNYMLGAYNDSGTPAAYSAKQAAFASFGDGLTDTEAANYYTAVQTFQTTLNRQVGVPIVADADAQAFLNAAVITDSTQASAVNTLVTDLKGYGIWTKMKALYPFVGGTASQHKYNLRNPLDTDAAFRLVFNGGITHSSSGIQGNGVNAFANTFYNTNANNTISNMHHSVYIRTNQTVDGATIGGMTGFVGSILIPKNSGNNTLYSANNAILDRVGNYVTSTNGLFTTNKVDELSIKLFKNSSIINSGVTSSNSTNPFNIYLLACNQDNAMAFPDVRQIAIASLGNTLTDTEAANYYTAVQAFQTTLSRNV